MNAGRQAAIRRLRREAAWLKRLIQLESLRAGLTCPDSDGPSGRARIGSPGQPLRPGR